MTPPLDIDSDTDGGLLVGGLIFILFLISIAVAWYMKL